MVHFGAVARARKANNTRENLQLVSYATNIMICKNADYQGLFAPIGRKKF
jgi:hypothetical protein